MKIINQRLEEVISKHKITKTENIIYGTNIPMPNMILPTPWKTYIKFDQVECYFFYFDDFGITIYQVYGTDYIKILWKDVVSFSVHHIFILGKLKIVTMNGTYQFQLNRFVFGCPWIRFNTKYLEEHQYFCPKYK